GPFDGKRLPGVAKASLYSQWDWLPWADDRFAVNLAGQYRSRIASRDDNSEFAPASTLWSLGVSGEQSWGASTLSAWARVENLTDKSAVGAVIVNQGGGRTMEPLPGRQMHVGVSWRRGW
ncbi:MAG TPA: iron transporter, partial [Cellvibrionaceae bacterium]